MLVTLCYRPPMRVVRWVGCVLVANIIGIYTVYPVVMVGLTFGSVFGLSSSVGMVGSVGSVGSTHVGQLTRFGSGDTRLLNPSVMGCSRFGSGGQFPCAIASPMLQIPMLPICVSFHTPV